MPTQYVLLLSTPRSASNLLIQILNLKEQSNAATPENQSGYFFMDAWDVREMELKNFDQRIQNISQDHRVRMMQAYQSGTNAFQAFLDSLDTELSTVFVKEHVPFIIDPVEVSKYLFVDQPPDDKSWTVSITPVHQQSQQQQNLSELHSRTNPTFFSDRFLSTWSPTLLIRHPALSIPSVFRIYKRLYPADTDLGALEAPLKAVTTFHFSRLLFDWYNRLSKGNKDPRRLVVLDAEDIIHDEQVCLKYSQLIGLNSDKVRFGWDQATDAEKQNIENSQHHSMRETLLTSSGVVKDKAPKEVDINVEAKKWVEEFGENIGSMMEDWVRNEMADYEYLRSYRFRC